MALTADIELQGGIAVEGAYVRVLSPHVNTTEDTFGNKTHRLEFQAVAWKSQEDRAAGVAPLMYHVPGLGGMDNAAVYEPDGDMPNIFAAAYAHLKTLDAMAGAVDVLELEEAA